MNNKTYKYFHQFGRSKLLCIILCLINNPIWFPFEVYSYCTLIFLANMCFLLPPPTQTLIHFSLANFLLSIPSKEDTHP